MIDALMAAAVISGGFSLTFLAIVMAVFLIDEIREKRLKRTYMAAAKATAKTR